MTEDLDHIPNIKDEPARLQKSINSKKVSCCSDPASQAIKCLTVLSKTMLEIGLKNFKFLRPNRIAKRLNFSWQPIFEKLKLFPEANRMATK